jgi:type IV pilus assembly protein PilM
VAAPVQLATASISDGALLAGIGESNLRQSAEITTALRGALARIEMHGRAATLIVPDASVRVFLLDFDTFPARRDEALPILRFRLRKSVSFDVEHAAVSYQVLSEGSARTETPWKILAVLMPASVRDEYEGLMRSVGLEPGVVLPTGLAALCPLQSQRAELIVSHGRSSLTIAIVSGSDYLLYRTSDLPADEAGHRAEVQRAVAVACAFYEDTLRAMPGGILYAGSLSLKEFSAMLEESSLAVEPLIGLDAIPSAAGVADYLRGLASAVVGALAGAG